MGKRIQDHTLMNLTGKVNVLKTFPYALQQVLAMFVTNLVPLWAIVAVSGRSRYITSETMFPSL